MRQALAENGVPVCDICRRPMKAVVSFPAFMTWGRKIIQSRTRWDCQCGSMVSVTKNGEVYSALWKLR